MPWPGPLLNPRDSPISLDRGPRRVSDSQCLQLLGNLSFGSVEASEKHAAPVIEIIGDDRAILKLEPKGSL
jgi:hypothetical protein